MPLRVTVLDRDRCDSRKCGQPCIRFCPRVKLVDYAEVRADVFEFCRYYVRWLGSPLMGRLKHEINQILEGAIDWWGKQDIFDAMER